MHQDADIAALLHVNLNESCPYRRRAAVTLARSIRAGGSPHDAAEALDGRAQPQAVDALWDIVRDLGLFYL
ncbi:hypothetical protein SAMN05216548_102364 [Faunimonas pinastri]|uniref:Uncharacterized protein n=1 Tax=Faunimonas pinastri TaxID=1855383 RepID=A0A1H9D6I0_9HYPH|nr:hypothetical protein [Faunimonas pinastri]SEQ08989.1 hypothetical protein SAMN05216548_102364 [Faunimonas pinastri]